MVQHLRVSAPWLRQRGSKCGAIQVSSYYDPFFGIEDGEETGDLSEAVDFCNGTADGFVCPVRHGCLLFALTNNEKYGVWGGTTPQTRRAIRKQWPLRRGKVPRPEWRFMIEKEAMDMLSERDRAELQAETDAEDEWTL
jgi:hypothetical protein